MLLDKHSTVWYTSGTMNNRNIPPEIVGESLIPYIGEDTNMNMYLGLRACGLTVVEARNHARIAAQTLKEWRCKNSDFKYWDGPGIRKLRNTFRDSCLNELAVRNITLVMISDAHLLAKDPNTLTDDEKKEVSKIKKNYSLDKLKALREGAEGAGVNVSTADKAIDKILKGGD